VEKETMSQTKIIKQQNKKQQKELKRRKRQKHQGIRRAQAQRRSEFPQFELGPTGISELEFVDAVYAAARKVNFDDRQHFKDVDRLSWRTIAQIGANVIEEWRRSANRDLYEQQENFGDMMSMSLVTNVSQAIYSLIPDEVKERFMPYNYFTVIPTRNKLVLHTGRLITKRTPKGSIHLSRSPVIVDVDGERRTLAFTTHAMERVCERIAPGWKVNYVDLMEIARFFSCVPSFEMEPLNSDQNVILLYASCGPSFTDLYWIHVDHILGRDKVKPDSEPPEYRLGYCPLALDGRYAIAKTLLLPGYRMTPEYRLLSTSVLPRERKTELFEMTRDHVRDTDRFEEWLPLVKWFHENGVPQVRQRASESQPNSPL
jgi:hypothetical protein